MAGMAGGTDKASLVQAALGKGQAEQREAAPQVAQAKPKDPVANIKSLIDTLDYAQVCDVEAYLEERFVIAEEEAIKKALEAMGGRGVVTFNNVNYKLDKDKNVKRIEE